MTAFRVRFESMVAALRAHPRVEVLQEVNRPPASGQAIASAERLLRAPLRGYRVEYSSIHTPDLAILTCSLAPETGGFHHDQSGYTKSQRSRPSTPRTRQSSPPRPPADRPKPALHRPCRPAWREGPRAEPRGRFGARPDVG